MISINRFSQTLKNSGRKFVTGMAKGGLAPIILLELAVTGGRTYQAHKRGGFIESRERGTEETLGAIFWFGGVTAFNKLGDLIGQKLFKLPNIKDLDFDVMKDSARNPLENFMAKNPNFKKSKLATFKITKIAASILLANAFVGFIVPKLNQKITKAYQNSIKKGQGKVDTQAPTKQQHQTAMDSFLNKNNKSDVAFKGFLMDTVLPLTHKFENDATYKLLSTDVGIAGGRGISARNKNERREVLFRDIASIYFYMFCKSHLNSILNYIQDGRASRLDPVSANIVHNKLTSFFVAHDQSYSSKEFLKKALGNEDAKIPEGMIFKNGIIKLEDFKKIESNETIQKLATRMAKLQPKTVAGSILTRAQVLDVYKGGLINQPRLLNKIFEQYTEKKSTDPMKFVPEKDLRALKENIINYVKDIAKKAEKSGEDVTIDLLKKMNKQNFRKNAFNLGAGLTVSAVFLSTIIPKIQYWMTKKQTGNDKFPGVE